MAARAMAAAAGSVRWAISCQAQSVLGKAVLGGGGCRLAALNNTNRQQEQVTTKAEEAQAVASSAVPQVVSEA